ncbi:MAG: histone deacetylase [Opitutaceae bacterium]|jgi:acetoin utilization deacetylase AcuC-like enzyme
MVILHDPQCADFGIDARQEKPVRVVETVARLHASHPEWSWLLPPPVDEEILLLAHTRAHLQRLQAPPDFDDDTPFFDGIYSHACRSVAAALEAMRLSLTSRQKAFSLMRPPGHHATAGQAMGFCYLNQAAVTAFAAQSLGAAKVAVWDFDAHHGNGTEAILDGRPGMLFCSVHQFPGYPGTGTRNTANCFNWAIGPHGLRDKHMETLELSLRRIIAFKPDLLLLSAGFDAYVNDPVAAMTLEVEDFSTLGRWVRECGITTAGMLEGGYSRDLPGLVDAFLGSWEG